MVEKEQKFIKNMEISAISIITEIYKKKTENNRKKIEIG